MNTPTLQHLLANLRQRRESADDIKQLALGFCEPMPPSQDANRPSAVGKDTASQLMGRMTSALKLGDH